MTHCDINAPGIILADLFLLKSHEATKTTKIINFVSWCEVKVFAPVLQSWLILVENSHLNGYGGLSQLWRPAMRKKQFSIAEAKNKLPALIHDAESGSPVELTRRGVPVAVILSRRKYEELTAQQSGFWKKLTALRSQIEKEQIMISDDDFISLRDHSTGRVVELAT